MAVKIKIADSGHGIQMPNLCVMCGTNQPTEFIGHELPQWTRVDKVTVRTYYLNFPYCRGCVDRFKKAGFFSRIKSAVDIKESAYVYGKMFRKKTLKYLVFEFENHRFAELFIQANRGITLANAIKTLEK